MKDILEFAVNMEKDGISYYEKLAEQSPHKLLSRIFLQLAEEEARHIDAIEAIAARVPYEIHSSVVSQAKSVFAELAEQGAGLVDSPDVRKALAQAYRIAWEAEQESLDLYQRAAQKASDPLAAKVLAELARQEEEHMILVDILFKIMSQPCLTNNEILHEISQLG